MSLASTIKCPDCGTEFEPNNAIREQVENELRIKMKDWQQKKDEDYRRRETEFEKKLSAKDDELNFKLAQEKKKLQTEIESATRKTLHADYENEIKLLQQANAENEEKLKTSRKKELEFLQQAQDLKRREEELDLNMKKKMVEEREILAKEIRRVEEQKLLQMQHDYNLRLAEKEKQLETQIKLAAEMKRKAEQGSMQLQGEVQEIMLENILQMAFPHDKILPVSKGVRGADCIQTICNPYGNECGKIIYESKRTANFGTDWIDKLKADKLSQGADLAVIVTQTLPRDMERFGEKDGVYICTFSEVRSLSVVLRNSIMEVFKLTRSQENKGDKMHMLYNYLTSHEFNEQWKAIREGFLSLKMSIQKERDQMEKMWKAREKQLDKVLLNAVHIKGSVEGIAGADAVHMDLLDDDTQELLD